MSKEFRIEIKITPVSNCKIVLDKEIFLTTVCECEAENLGLYLEHLSKRLFNEGVKKYYFKESNE